MICNNCASPLGQDDKFCPTCGSAAPSPVSAFTNQPVVNQPLTSQIICGNCSNPMLANDMFCQTCGSAAPPPVSAFTNQPVVNQPLTSQIICGNCSSPMLANDMFCPTCGSAAPPPVSAFTNQPAVNQPLTSQIICRNCSSPMLANDMFCQTCGSAALSPVSAFTNQPVVNQPLTSQIICGNCSSPMLANDMFCPICGAQAQAVQQDLINDQGNGIASTQEQGGSVNKNPAKKDAGSTMTKILLAILSILLLVFIGLFGYLTYTMFFETDSAEQTEVVEQTDVDEETDDEQNEDTDDEENEDDDDEEDSSKTESTTQITTETTTEAVTTTESTTSTEDDLDEIIYVSTYDEATELINNYNNYLGRFVEMTGIFAIYEDTSTGVVYCRILISNTALNSFAGIEFILDGYEYPDGYPTVAASCTVAGEFEIYEEYGSTYCRLKDAYLVS